MPRFGAALATLTAAIRNLGVELSFTWVPAHDRHPNWKPSNPALTAAHLRSLNEAADRVAKACVARRLHGSLREKWFVEAERVKAWETAAARASAQAAERLHNHLKSVRILPREHRGLFSCANGLPPEA